MKRLILLVSVAALVMPLQAIAASHEEERAPLTDVWIVVPKQGMETQFEEAVKSHMTFRADAEDSREWQAYRPVIGDKLNVYQFRACCLEWGDQDSYIAEDEEKAFGANWNENVHQYVDHYHHYFEVNDWQNSHWPEEGTDGPYYGVTSWTWKEGSYGPGTAARKRLSQMAKDDGWADAGHEWLWLSRVGGKPMLAIVTSFADYSEMGPPEPSFFEFVSEQLGSEEEAGKLFAQFGSSFASSDYTVWRHDEALSVPED